MSENNNDLGHPDHDGIEELDNRLPRWWLATLFGAMLFAAVYWFYFHTTGVGPSQREELAADEKVLAEKREKASGGADDTALVAASQNPEAVARGAEIFRTNCIACHGAKGEGGIGPNLTDEYWIHGGRPAQMFKVITTGVAEKGMPAWGHTLGQGKVTDAAAYVLTIANTKVPGKPPQGEKVTP